MIQKIFEFFTSNASMSELWYPIVVAFILFVAGGLWVIIKKPFSKKEKIAHEESKENAIYLSEHLSDENKSLEPILEREEKLKNVLNIIKGEESNFFIGNHVYIAGQEGIGKTLFCKHLFNIRLKPQKIYTGYVTCNGYESIFKIIGKTFKDSRIKGKNKKEVLTAITSLERPCVLFIDQIDQYTPIEELKELIKNINITVVASGLLKSINHIHYDKHFILEPLSEKSAIKIFEDEAEEEIDNMGIEDKSSVRKIINDYVKGNPFLAKAFASAKSINNGKWKNVLKNMRPSEYYDENLNNHFKNKLKACYKIDNLENDKTTLEKLSIFSSQEFVEIIFRLCNIPMESVKRLSKTHWMEQKDKVLYYMKSIHKDVLNKVFTIDKGLEDVINSITQYFESWGVNKNRGFEWLSYYVEDILKKVEGHSRQIMESDLFAQFTYEVAQKYSVICNYEKSNDWLEYCNPSDKMTRLVYNKSVKEFQNKSKLLNSRFTSSDVEEAYLKAVENAERLTDSEDNKKFLVTAYCHFLNNNKQYDETKEICKEYFSANRFSLKTENDFCMYYQYLFATYYSNDSETLKLLITNDIISSLRTNLDISVTIAWSFGTLARVYKKWEDKESANIYTQYAVILLNRKKSFFHRDINSYLNVSEDEFIEYMHSHDKLIESLEGAIDRGDPKALYLEGQYQERIGEQENIDKAYELYEKGALNNDLNCMCAAARMCYEKSEFLDFDKARRYWDYCCEREHIDSHYWLGILLLDEKYGGYDKKLALEYLQKTAEMGSEQAKNKLEEINRKVEQPVS